VQEFNHIKSPARLKGSGCFREGSARAHQETEAVSRVERGARWTCREKRTQWVPGRGGCPQAAEDHNRGSRGQPSVEGRPPVRAMSRVVRRGCET
jgi:hypothetical protein